MMKKKNNTYNYTQSPFYKLTSPRRLAKILNVDLEELALLQGLSNDYRRAWLHKINKKKWLNTEPSAAEASQYRPIDLPADKLKNAQKRIEQYLSRIEIPANVYSPTKGRSYIDNAAAHKGAAAIYSMDIESYFPNTNRSKIIDYFMRFMLCPEDVAVMIADIVMKDDGLPQGSPCSPILAYFANQKMWKEITLLVKESDCICTIYADDLTISGKVVPKKLVYEVQQIIRKHGMSVNPKKDKSSYKKPNKITGVIVHDGKLLLPNEGHLKLKIAKDEVTKARNKKSLAAAVNVLRSRQSQKMQIEKKN